MARAIDANELMVEIQVCSWDSEQDKERAEDLVLGMPTLTPPNEPLTPCDLCRYNPPSSFGGKPCCMCPAEAMTKEDNQNEKSNAIACLRGKLKSAGGYQWIRERKEEG